MWVCVFLCADAHILEWMLRPGLNLSAMPHKLSILFLKTGSFTVPEACHTAVLDDRWAPGICLSPPKCWRLSIKLRSVPCLSSVLYQWNYLSSPVMLNPDSQLNWIYKHLGDTFWACLWGCFQRRLIEMGRPTLNKGGTIPRTGVLDWIKREKWIKHQQLSLLAFWLRM